VKKYDQAGFSLPHVLLLLLLIGIIGFTGWRVYDAQRKSNNLLANNNSMKTSEKITSNNQKGGIDNSTNIKGDTSCDELEDKLKIQSISLNCPSSWSITYNEHTNGFWFDLYSPDYDNDGGPIAYTIKGGSFEISVEKTEYKDVKSIENFDYFNPESYESINGIDYVRGDCGHHDHGTCYIFINNGKSFEIGYYWRKDENDTNQQNREYISEFMKLINSIKVI
jgi:hypothetical protein